MNSNVTKKAVRIPCTIMRGGTSKGVFFYEKDIPPVGAARDQFLCTAMGSPDVRQIDGLGGADPLTSKVAIISASNRPGFDVDYTFAQVDIQTKLVGYSGNCGNITAGVGLFAVQEGIVPAQEPGVEVKIFNTNTSKLLQVYVPCQDGVAEEEGVFVCEGVPGTGPRLDVDLSASAGAITGKVLPTANSIDVLHVPGLGDIECSIVDVANPVVFVNAKDLGLHGRETPAELEAQPEAMDMLEKIRKMAAEMLKLSPRESQGLPMICFVSPPNSEEKGNHLICRLMFMQVMHKTYSGTAAVCTSVAAKIPDTIPFKCTTHREGEFIIAHPAGNIGVHINVVNEQGKINVERASFGRTARRIMDGFVYVLGLKA